MERRSAEILDCLLFDFNFAVIVKKGFSGGRCASSRESAWVALEEYERCGGVAVVQESQDVLCLGHRESQKPVLAAIRLGSEGECA
jgi:hypothetical protein